MKIIEIELQEGLAWRKRLLKVFYFNYVNCPYFGEVYPLVESVLLADVHTLSEINALSIRAVCDFLEMNTSVQSCHESHQLLEQKIAENRDNLLKAFPQISLSQPDEKIIRIIEICRMENADNYINAIGGVALYDKQLFLRNNIQLSFVQTQDYSYPQPAEKFYPHLSIIDVLMNCGKEGTQKLMHVCKFV
jgi:hypothetical protein